MYAGKAKERVNDICYEKIGIPVGYSPKSRGSAIRSIVGMRRLDRVD